MIKLKILSENRDNCQFKGEGGLSVWVQAFNKQFLLDTGYSNLFMKNAELLNLDLSKIDLVVLTHGHSDHSNGIKYLEGQKTIILHPQSFKDRWSVRKKEYAGFPMTKEELKHKHILLETKEPYEFYPNCYFVGEIPMIVDFEQSGNFATTLDESFTEIDKTEDDSAIVITTKKGLFIMTGCGHRGVCNTIERAKEITGISKVYAVFGGFHLRNLEKQKEKIDLTIEYFKQNKIKELYLGHCVTDEVINYIESKLKNTKIIRLSAGKEYDVNVLPLN